MPVEQKPRLDSSKTDVVVLGSPPPKNVVPITKIAERLDKVVNDAPPTRNRSPELILLTADYEEMKRNLRMLVFVMKDHADTTDKVHASRDKVRNMNACMHAPPQTIEANPLFVCLLVCLFACLFVLFVSLD
jgi:hypothetical protein